jgi:hypothetical protein
MPSEPVEIGIGFTLLLLGVTLIVPGDNAYYTLSEGWHAAYLVLPSEDAAGVIMMALALLKFYGVLFSDKSIRRVASMVACIFFLFIMCSFISSSIFSPWTLFLVGAVESAWVFIRLGRPW